MSTLHSNSRNWNVGVSSDVSSQHDVVSYELQWFTTSVGYAPRNFWMPLGARVGYRKNLAGSELSSANVGLTLFKMLHMDVAYGLESIEAEGLDIPVLGNTLPRMLQANVGIDFLF